MIVTTYIRAKLFRSTDAAYRLALSNQKFIPFADKMISVKNTLAHCKKRQTAPTHASALSLQLQIHKYEALLKNLNFIYAQTRQRYENTFLYYNCPQQCDRDGAESVFSTVGTARDRLFFYRNKLPRVRINPVNEAVNHCVSTHDNNAVNVAHGSEQRRYFLPESIWPVRDNNDTGSHHSFRADDPYADGM